MGSFISKNSELEDLKNRLKSLEGADTNGDGVISRSEFDQMFKQQDENMKALKERIEAQAEEKYLKDLMIREREVNDAKKEIAELQKELESLKHINSVLENGRINGTNSNTSIQSTTAVVPHDIKDVSKERINAFVETLLQNKEINIKYLPDAVERQIYRNVFGILVGLMDNLFDSASIKFMGHKVTFALHPMTDQEVAEDKKEKEDEQKVQQLMNIVHDKHATKKSIDNGDNVIEDVPNEPIKEDKTKEKEHHHHHHDK